MLSNFKWLFLLLSILAVSRLEAQQRFKAGLVLGLNAAQIQGDDIGGYNKLGLAGGLRAVVMLKEKQDILVELLYSQRGSRSKIGQVAGDPVKIKLQYIEVPVLFSYKDWLDEDANHYKMRATGGFSYGRLIEAAAEGSKHDDLTEEFFVNDLSFVIGFEFFPGPHVGFGVRWNRSLTLLFDNENFPGRNSLYGYFLAFRSNYIF
jgi:hypothetical protein